MALVLVLTNLRLRQQPIGVKFWMAGAWVTFIVLAAVTFAGLKP